MKRRLAFSTNQRRIRILAAATSGFLVLAGACSSDGRDSAASEELAVAAVTASATAPADALPPGCFESVRDALFSSDAITNGIHQALAELPPLPPDATNQQRAERDQLISQAEDAGQMGAEMDFAQTGADSDVIQAACDKLQRAAEASARGVLETSARGSE